MKKIYVGFIDDSLVIIVLNWLVIKKWESNLRYTVAHAKSISLRLPESFFFVNQCSPSPEYSLPMGILVSILAGDGELYAWGNGACGQ